MKPKCGPWGRITPKLSLVILFTRTLGVKVPHGPQMTKSGEWKL